MEYLTIRLIFIIERGINVFKFYLISIGLFYLSLLLLYIRYLVNKGEITFKKNKEKWFVYIKIIVISFLPVLNIFFVIVWIYGSLLAERENFIKLMNK